MKQDGEQRTLSACLLCGRCTSELFSLTRDERHTPRFALWNVKKGRKSPLLYTFLLNGRSVCPVGVDIDAEVIGARRKLVKEGLKTVKNVAVVQKLLEGKNPY